MSPSEATIVSSIEAIALVMASLGVFQALLLTAYLLTISQRRRLAHRLFALMLIGLSIRIGKSIFNYYLDIEPWQRNIGLAGLLLVGPSFWLYGKAIGERLSGLSKRHWLHFAPAALYVLFCWLIPNQKNWASYLSYALVTGQWAIYLVLSFRQSRGITQTLSLEAKTWHRQILIGLVVLWFYYLLVFVGVLPYYLGGAVTYTLLMGGLTVLLLNRKHFSAGKYDQTNQSSEESRSAMARIEQAMRARKLYLDPKLTVAKLGDILSLSPRQVSRAVNEQCGVGFAAFLKQYRLEHAKSLLANPDHRKAKIATIAVESGFGNVASFNSAFNEVVNCPPSEYRKRALRS